MRDPIEFALVPYHCLDRQGRILEANEEWLNVLGYSRHEVIGIPFQRCLNKPNNIELPRLLEKIQETGVARDIAMECLRADGTPVSMSFAGQAELDADHQYVCTHCVLTNFENRIPATKKSGEEEIWDRQLFERSPEAIIIHNESAILLANPPAARLLGFDGQDQLIGTRLKEIVHPDSIEHLLRTNKNVGRTKAACDPQGQLFRCRDGLAIHVEATSQAVRVDGEWVIQSILRDVTRQHQYQKALAERESKLASIMAVAPIGIGTVQDQVFLQVNHRFCEMLGRQPSELLGKGLDAIYPSIDEFNRVLREKNEQVKNAGMGAVETQFVTKSGETIDILLRSMPLDPMDLTKGETFTALDITKLKTSERRLIEERDFANAIFETAAALVVVLDPKGRIIRFNKACERVTGFDRHEVIGKLLWETVIPPEELDTARAVFDSGFNPDPIVDFENIWITKNGDRRLIRWSNSWLEDTEGEIFGIGIGVDITERRLVEKALVDSEKRFRHLFENMQEGMFLHELVTDKKGKAIDYRIIDANPAVKQQTGIDAQEAIGKLATDLYQVDEPPYLDVYERVARTRQPTTFEVFFEPMDRHFHVSAFSPRQGIFTTVFRDITVRKNAENNAKRDRERLERVLEAAGEGIYAIDTDGKCVFCNSAAQKFLGFDGADRVIGKDMSELVRFRRSDHLREPMEERSPHLVSVTGKPLDGKNDLLIECNGMTFSAEVSAYPMYVGDTVTGAVICFSDISERKRTQEWMQRLSLAVEQSPVSIAISNANGEFTYVNPCLSSATGYGLNDLRTASLLKPNAHKSNDQVLSDIRKYLANGEQWRSEVLVGKKAGGSFLADLVVSPIIDFQGAIVSHLWIFENVTEQRRLENELRQAQKMESLGQLTGGVAHDFNNILAVVLTNAEILSDDLEGDSLSAPVVAAIIRAVYRGSALTERLLAFSRRSELSPTPTDVSAVVTDMRDMLQRSLGETISVEVEAESGLPSVVLDQSQFENALVNLSVNARDAMPSGGRLYLEVTRGSPRSNTGKDELNGGVPHVCVSVSDTGCGIPTSLLERIYEPFFTTKKKGEGTGFGLSMVYGFVKQSGGEIRVDSTEGVGTTFRLFFPACSDGGREFHVDRPVQAAALSDYKPLSALNILLVEDDEHVRDSTKMMLRGDGHTVSAASAGEEALECLKTSPDIELVISDVVMPGKINGRDLAFEARKIRPDIKLLFTSGYSAGRLSEEDLHKFQAKFLPKPYSKNDLDEAIAELISGRR